MSKPTRILDLHTHLFNARYLPLAGIIAGAMNKKESKLASGVAKLLNALAESSYSLTYIINEHDNLLDEKSEDEFYLDRIWEVTQFELQVSSGSSNEHITELDPTGNPPTKQLCSEVEFSRILDAGDSA